MGLFQKKHLLAIIYGLLLALLTLYVSLDTFVISRVYQVVPQTKDDARVPAETITQPDSGDELPGAVESGPAPSVHEGSLFADSIQITDNTYSDTSISITLTQYREYDTDIYVADIMVSSVEFLRAAFAKNTYGRNINEKTSQIAETHNAILAINGDYYGSQTKGYVLRNGELYRETMAREQEDLVVWANGSFEIITESGVSASKLLEDGAAQVFSFGPALVDGGDIVVQEGEEINGKSKASNPRTAIGIVEDLHYLFVVSDGRTNESMGLSLYQLAGFMQRLGAKVAYNLDGGGSSAMVFNGEIVNKPTTNGRRIEERSVSDIVYIGYPN